MAVKGPFDSLSRCDPTLYSNIYDVRKRPDAKIEPLSMIPSVSKDILEISHDKLKEEALNRLRHTTKYVIAQNSFMRIGQYLFLALALPPFLMLYGLPKWLFVEGLPTLLATCIWMWKKFQQTTQQQVETGTRKVVQLLEFMQQMNQRLLIQPIVRLALEIQQGIRQMFKHFSLFFQSIKHRATVVLTKPGLKIIEKFRQVQHQLSRVKEKITQQAQEFKVGLQQGLQWIQKSRQIFLNWGKLQVQRLHEQAVYSSARWVKQIQTSQQLAQQTAYGISIQCQQGWRKFKAGFNPLMVLYRQEILPQWLKLKEASKSKGQQARDFFHQKHQKALIFMQKRQEKLKNLSYIREVDRLLARGWISKLPLSLQQCLKKWLYHSFIRRFCDEIIQIYVFFASHFLQITSQVLKMLSKGTVFVFKTYHRLCIFFGFVTQKAALSLKIGQKALNLAAFHMLYYTLLSLMIASILCLWGIRLLVDLTRPVTRKMSDLMRSLIFLKPTKQ